jgi:hypothetical protein
MGMLVIINDKRWFFNKKRQNTTKYRQNPRGKPGSVFFPTDKGRRIHLSVGKIT